MNKAVRGNPGGFLFREVIRWLTGALYAGIPCRKARRYVRSAGTGSRKDGRRDAMIWIAWVMAGIAGLNAVIFGTLYVINVIEQRREKNKKGAAKNEHG